MYGHVDTTSKVVNIKKRCFESFRVYVIKNIKKLLIEKASILINGVSLTISKITKKVLKFGLFHIL